MCREPMIRNERGIALVVVLLVVVAVAAIIAGSALLSSSTSLIARHEARLGVLETTADAGLEEARSRINGDRTQYPNSSFVSLENGATVYAADGSVIPNVQRWLYVGPSGVTTGQYGVFGSIVSMTQDVQGDRVVRRAEVSQESFAKYAYFTTVEGNIVFANGDQIRGPVFSDDFLNVASSGATFFGPVATHQKVNGKAFGVFKQGLKEGAPFIPMPTTSDLNKLQGQAAVGGTAITGTFAGNPNQATTRIEFVALDLNNDGDSTDDDEGFMKVYQANSPADAYWVVADTKPTALDSANGALASSNCVDSLGAAPAKAGPPVRCYLGGSDILNNSKQFVAADNHGSWQQWTGPVDPRVLTLRTDARYLWPITRALNPNFRGVVFVNGKVAVSGKLRGRLTLAATGSIIVADDIRYETLPGSANCADILGLFSGGDIVVADNFLNDPTPYYWTKNVPKVTPHYDETSDEFIDGFILALGSFTAWNYDLGPTSGESCQGLKAERGCLFVAGGIIQTTRGAVGQTSGRGYVKRYSWDQCGSTNPPPYFPTTGHFARGHYYEVDPTGFNVNSYWSLLVPH